MNDLEFIEEMRSSVVGYLNLLSRMDQLTDSLHSAIRNSDMESVSHLLEARSVLLNQIFESSNTIASSLENLRSRNGASSAPSGPEWDVIKTSLENASRLENALLKKQTSCEYELGRKMDECKNEMSSLKIRKGLNQAYRKPSGTSASRFIDDKM